MLKPRDFSTHEWTTTKLRNKVVYVCAMLICSQFLTCIAEMEQKRFLRLFFDGEKAILTSVLKSP